MAGDAGDAGDAGVVPPTKGKKGGSDRRNTDSTDWAAPRFLVQAKWEFSSTPSHFGILSSFDLISASLRSQAALNSFGVS